MFHLAVRVRGDLQVLVGQDGLDVLIDPHRLTTLVDPGGVDRVKTRHLFRADLLGHSGEQGGALFVQLGLGRGLGRRHGEEGDQETAGKEVL